MIFARELTGPLTSLVKQIDKATADNSGCKMGSFIVFLSDDEAMEKKLKEFSDQEDLKRTVVTLLSSPAGPPEYGIAQKAAVTVVLYNRRKVEANYAFEKDGLTEKGVAQIIGDLAKIVPRDEKK